MVNSYNTNRIASRVLCFSAIVALSLTMGGCSISMGGMFGKGDSDDEITGTATQPVLTAPVGSVSQSTLPVVEPDLAQNTVDPETPALVTGSVQQAAAPVVAQPDAKLPVKITPSDWGYARGALGLALTGPENTPPVPWANPDTGSRGNFAPAAPAEVRNGVTCRSFVASRFDKAASQKMEGTACRTAEGYWAIEEAKPVL